MSARKKFEDFLLGPPKKRPAGGATATVEAERPARPQPKPRKPLFPPKPPRAPKPTDGPRPPGGSQPAAKPKGKPKVAKDRPGITSANPSFLTKLNNIEIGKRKIKSTELMHFCRFMSAFLTGGIPILDALDTVRQDTKNKQLKRLIISVAAEIRAGETFSTAIAGNAKRLPSFFVHMVRAAEETGQLADVLAQMADYIERDVEAKRKIKAALTYPLIVIGMAIGSVAILVGFVLPRFVVFFDDFHAQLPLPTRILVAISAWSTKWGPTIGAIAIGLGLVLFALNLTQVGKLYRDTLLLRTPVISGLVVYAVVERFCRVLGGMVQAGVPLPTAVELAANGSGNRRFAQRVRRARREMLSGAGLSGPLTATKMFPSAAVQMLRVGEETGTLENQLNDVSTFYGKELAYRLKRRTDMLEPMAVVFVGVIVGFVAIAIISAIYGVYHGADLQ